MKTTAQLILTFLLNSSWQIILIAAAATLCDWLLRGTLARYRHAIWVAALLLSLLIPGLSTPSLFVRTSTAPVLPQSKIESTPVVITTIRSLEGDEIESTTPPTAAATEAAPKKSFSPVRISRNWAAVLVVLYAMFVLYAGLRFFRAWRRTRRLVKTAFLCELPESVQAIIEGCERAISVRGARILCSHSVAVPITVGTLRPLIILPSSLLRKTDEEVLTSAIGHELVHVARRDYLTNLIYEFVYLPLSFHPAAMLMRRRIRDTRELCCDERVATSLLKPEIYARSLVRLIGSVPITRRLAADTTIGIAESDNLEVRIMSILKMRRLSTRRNAFLLAIALMVLAVPSVAATSFALTFEINRQEPQGQSRKVPGREDLGRLRAQLEGQVQELKERQKQAPAAQRAEIEARIREVQRDLDEHQQLLQQYEKQRQGLSAAAEARLNEVQRNLEEHAKLLEMYQMQDPQFRKSLEAQQKLKELLSKYPENTQMAETQRLLEETRAKSDGQQNRHARVIYRVEPTYPDDAREKQIKGSVLLTLTVGHDGLPQNIQIKQSLFPSMDQAAIDAARQMRFEPAMKDGQPVSDVLLVEFYFSMQSKHVEVMGSGTGKGEGAGTGQVFDVRRRKEQEVTNQDDRARRQAELVQGANISMDRAIQIATSNYPGKVLACSLGRDKDGPVFYHLVIINTEGEKRTVKYVWISAIDGTIIKTEDESRGQAAISGGVLNGKAISLPDPAYPEIARAARASGSVTVQVTVDERGNVISADAVAGHPLLQGASVAAARQAKFTPTLLGGQPIKVSGQLMYNFVAQ